MENDTISRIRDIEEVTRNVKSINTEPLDIVSDERMKTIIKNLVQFICCMNSVPKDRGGGVSTKNDRDAASNESTPTVYDLNTSIPVVEEERLQEDLGHRRPIVPIMSEWYIDHAENGNTNAYIVNLVFRNDIDLLEISNNDMHLIGQYQPLVKKVSVCFEKEQQQGSFMRTTDPKYRAVLRVRLEKNKRPLEDGKDSFIPRKLRLKRMLGDPSTFEQNTDA